MEGHPNKELKNNWKYYLEEAQQEEAVEKQLEDIRKEYSAISPEEIKLIDPCMGSGHILVYAFDVLMQIYDSMGYTARDAVRNIVENNIYGLDIDNRAAQLSYFAMMMKARQYDRRFLGRNIQPNVYAIRESNGLDQYAIDYFCNGNSKLTKAINSITTEMHDAKEYGSIIDVTPVDFNALYARFNEVEDDINMSREVVLNELLPLVQVAEVMAQKYDAVITNPPYMGRSGMNIKLSDFVKKNYPDSKSDLFAVFVEKGNNMTVNNGFNCMVTMQSWMFLSSFEKMRINALKTRTLTNLMHMGNMVMGIAFGTAVSIFRNSVVCGYRGTYNHIRMQDIDKDIPREFPIKKNRFSQISTDTFSKIPGNPVAYWVGKQVLKAFEGSLLGDYGYPKQGFATGDNNTFLRFWQEVDVTKIGFGMGNREIANQSGKKWFPCNKGGSFRRWYGNNIYLANWQDDGKEMTEFKGSVIRNPQYYFRQGITWSSLTSGKLSMRYSPKGFLFESKGSVCFMKNEDNLWYILGLMNTEIVSNMLSVLSPTLDYHEGPISRVPIIISDKKEQIEIIVKQNVEICKNDWDSFENSWDFKKHPLLGYETDKVSTAFEMWAKECAERFNQLKANEEELNRIFIDIYGLRDELTPEVEDKDVTVRKADLQRDIKSLISYAVGCMFGRYSLDVEGIAYAGGEWDDSKYMTFIPDADNCIPMTDEEYFEDDIVGLFCAWLKKVYGEDTLEENLDFIANALGNKGKTSREVIRNYFLTDFIKDHIKTYQKRPIYWLFDSGKQNGFKVLVYMHRWNADTIGNVRVEYLHRIQRVYEKEIARMQEIIDNSDDNKEISNATKRKEKLQKQIKETKDYDAKIAHLALSRIDIDLDDGVKVNYGKVQTADGKKMQILAKI